MAASLSVLGLLYLKAFAELKLRNRWQIAALLHEESIFQHTLLSLMRRSSALCEDIKILRMPGC